MIIFAYVSDSAIMLTLRRAGWTLKTIAGYLYLMTFSMIIYSFLNEF